jgi:DNA polymerase-3 subunit epsilon
VLTLEEMKRLLDATTCLKHQAALSVAYGAGLRVAEVSALKVSDVDSERMLLRIERGRGGTWGYQGARRAAASGGVSHRAGGRRRNGGAAGRATRYRSPGQPEDGTRCPPPGANAEASGADDAEYEPPLDLEPLQRRAEAASLWVDKHVVFTGVLRSMQRYQAEALAQALGATCQASVSRKTNVVVIGEPDRRTLSAGRRQSVKEAGARQRALEGQPIEFVTERAFLRILAGEEGVHC